jgi:hypothetical protein
MGISGDRCGISGLRKQNSVYDETLASIAAKGGEENLHVIHLAVTLA